MILLVDGNNLAATMNAVGGLSRKDGFPTQAISGCLKLLRFYVTEFEPQKVFIAWDGGKSRKRLALLPSYKESRAVEKKTPEQVMNFKELLAQLPIIKRATIDMGLYQLGGPGIEADDMLALMAKKADQVGEQAVIISSDSDFYQLVSPRVSVYSVATKKKYRHITHANFTKALDGLLPEQFLEFKALQGDGSDDVPGVNGIGPATARKLLLEHGSVDKWHQAVESKTCKPPTKTLQKIIDQWDGYQLSKSMIDLHNPLADFSTARIVKQEANWPALRAAAIEYEIGDIYTNFAAWIKPFKELR